LGPELSTLFINVSDFSVQENILRPQPFKKSTAAFKLVTLQTGILNSAPAEVLQHHW